MLTKQLQTLIDVSLSAGRSFDDIRDILQLQGFDDEAVDQLFAAYRERPSVPAQAAAAATLQPSAPTPVPTPAAPAAPPSVQPTPTAATSTAPASPPPVASVVPKAPVYEAPVIMPHPGVVAPPVTPQAPPVAPQTPPAIPQISPEPAPVGTIVSRPSNIPEWAQTPTAAASTSGVAPSSMPPQAMPQSTVPVAPDVRPLTPPTAPAAAPAYTAAPASTYTPQAPVDLSRAFDGPTGPVGMAAPQAAPLRGTLDQPIPSFSTMPAAGSINVGLGGMPELEQAQVEAYQRKVEKSPVRMIIVLVLVLAMIAGFVYWFFFLGPGAPIEPQTTLTDIRTATSGVDVVPDLSGQPPADIDPFTGALRSVEPVATVPVASPTTAQGCIFMTDLALDDTGEAVTQAQEYFTAIGMFARFAEQGKLDGTAPNFTVTPGTYDKQMQLAVKYYQSVMFAADRSNANVQPGIIDFPTRAAMEDDCTGGKFERYHQQVLDEALNQKARAAVASVRVHVYSYFDTNGTYAGMCDRSPQIKAQLDAINQVTGDIGGATCRATNGDWIIATPLHGVGGYYCTDSSQNTGEVANLLSNQMKCR